MSPPRGVEWNWSVYNPALVERQELIRRFLVTSRRDLLQELAGLLRGQTGVPPRRPRHGLITGPRGSGKTTLLLRLRYLVEEDPALCVEWRPLVLPEEMDQLAHLGELFVTLLDNLGDDDALRAKLLRESALDEEQLLRSALAALRDSCDRSGKRLLLLIDNLDAIAGVLPLAQIQKLTSLLVHEQRFLVIASIPFHKKEEVLPKSLAKEFIDFPLDDLSQEEFLRLLSDLALLSRNPRLVDLLAQQAPRSMELYHLTGGNLRTAILLYRLLSESSTEHMSILAALDRLLDDVTPLYQSRIKMLPPQQRRVFAAIAQQWHPVDAATLGRSLLLKPNVVSAQISRLIAERYVERIGRGRPPRYRISERLFNIYWLMRQGGSGKRNLQLLLELLDSLVSNENVFALARRAIEEGVSQRIQTWSESITDLFYVSEVMSRTPDRIKRAELLLGLLDLLRRQRSNPERRAVRIKVGSFSELIEKLTDHQMLSLYGKEQDQLISRLADVLAREPENADAWYFQACLLYSADRFGEAEHAAMETLRLGNNTAPVHLLLAKIYDCLDLQRADRELVGKAIDHCREAVRLDPTQSEGHKLIPLLSTRAPRGWISGEEISAAAEQATKVSPNNGEYWRRYALSQFEQNRYHDALVSIERSIALDPSDYLAIALKATILLSRENVSRPKQALDKRQPDWDSIRSLYQHLLDLFRGSTPTPEYYYDRNPLFQMFSLYLAPEQLVLTEETIRRALLEAPNEPRLLFNHAFVLGRLNRWPQALLAADAMLQLGLREKVWFLTQTMNAVVIFFLFAGVRGQGRYALELLERYTHDFVLAAADSPLRIALTCLVENKHEPPDEFAEEVRIVARHLMKYMQRSSENEERAVASAG